MFKVNLGCGSKFLEDWINIDLTSSSNFVIKHNFLKGIPLESNSSDIVYHSHVIEHLPKTQAQPFINECHRVLKPGGIIRIATPNLEGIVKTYLEKLEKTIAEQDIDSADEYDWILLELLDQTVRSSSGGEMGKWIFSENLKCQDFVIQRIGTDVLEWRKKKSKENRLQHRMQEIKKFLFKIGFIRKYLHGSFRESGEVHLWLYDKFSLSRLLLNTGFNNISVCTASTSNFDNWCSFKLDNETDSASIFIEGIK